MNLSRLFALMVGMFLLAGAATAQDLVVYSGRSDKFVKPVLDEFTRQTGIKVVLHSGSSTALLNKLRVEQQRTQADVFLSNDAGTLQQGSELGLFRPIPDTTANAIPAALRAPDNTWVGLSARARVLVVNSRSGAAGQVKSVFDLADPALKGKIGITDSANESFIAGTTVYMLAAGRDKTRAWLEGLKANAGRQVFNKHGAIVSAVASGRLDAGLVNHYYIYRHLKEQPDAPIRIVMPDQGEQGMGVAWNVAGAGIVRHARHPEAAERLLAFLVSEEGQRMFAEANLEYPTRTGVPAAAQVPAAGSYKVADVPMAELGRQRGATLDLIEEVGMP